MAGERAYPILPCPDVDTAVAFYEALGFTRTYRQLRPNPHAVVELDDLGVHLAGIDGFDPAASYASVIVTVPDVGGLHDAFAAGLRRAYGRLPGAGIPRLLRLRRKAGTATGFSVVDPGGNWLRFYQEGATDEEPEERSTGLARALEVAARQGDSRGDEAQALVVLDAALQREAGAPAAERAPLLLYRAELLARLDRVAEAAEALAGATDGLTADEAAALADDVEHAREVVEGA